MGMTRQQKIERLLGVTDEGALRQALESDYAEDRSGGASGDC